MNLTNFDNFFEPLENTSPYFKFAAQGEAGSGKTYTSALLAVGLHKKIQSTLPVVIFDTEKSAKFLKPLFSKNGIEVVTKRTRTLSDLVKTMEFCSQGGSNILIIDSITHVYEDFLKDYKKSKRNGGTYIDFADWGIIKPLWKERFSEKLVDAEYHIFFTGRQGYTYEQETKSNGQKEIVKTGVKMKAENETAYEPDVLVMMETKQSVLSGDKEIWREATVLKDRSTLIDGITIKNPTFKSFEPVIDILFDDVKDKVETESIPNSELITTKDGNIAEVTKKRKIAIERNDEWLNFVAPGTASENKAMKIALKNYAYCGETSDIAISDMNLDQLMEANRKLNIICKIIRDIKPLESKHLKTSKLITTTRLERLQNDNLGESSPVELAVYLTYLQKIKDC